MQSHPLKAVVLSCTLKKSPDVSNTEALAAVVITEMQQQGVEVELIRLVDHTILHGVTSDEGNGDEWPLIHEKLLAAQILVIATPTWLAHPSSLSQQVLERMDAMLSEQDAQGRPVAYDKVAGIVVTGNEDGAHHVISELSGALVDIGYTIPANSWTYWNKGPGATMNYLDTDYRHDWSAKTGKAAAVNLVAVARALQAMPLPVPPQE
jgi:multimeric flavodoxin WrbA